MPYLSPIIEALNGHLHAGRVEAIGAFNWNWKRIQKAKSSAQALSIRLTEAEVEHGGKE